jgi:hypothetical protein
MTFSTLLTGTTDQTWAISAPTNRNMFRLSGTKAPTQVNGQIETSKIEISQIAPNGDVFKVGLYRYEPYPQLIYLPLPEGWAEQRISIRLASAVYAPWDFLIEQDSDITEFPSGLTEHAIDKIEELLRVTPTQATIADSLILRIDCTGAFKSLASQASVDEVLSILKDHTTVDEIDRTNYVAIYEGVLYGPN